MLGAFETAASSPPAGIHWPSRDNHTEQKHQICHASQGGDQQTGLRQNESIAHL